MSSTLPYNIGSYTVEALIGEGDIARVYRAVNRLNGRQVALKQLRADSPVDRAKHYFKHEAAILARLSHPNIPAFYEYVTDEALALEIVDGKDGEALLTEVPEGEFLATRCVLQWGVHIAGALAYLHNHNPPIAFRDLKPAHLVADKDNRAWLVDFNLAKIMPDSKSLTNADAVGTQGFAPPEQYQGVVSPLVDVYGLGATLHYLLSRADPRKAARFTFAPLPSINPSIPEPVSAVILKALAHEAEDRYRDMQEMQGELENCLATL